MKNIREEYEVLSRDYESLKSEIIYTLDNTFNNNDIKIHSISGRVKEWNSLEEKMIRKEATSLSEIVDIVGVRIVCLFRSDIMDIVDIINNIFNVIIFDDKIKATTDSTFGYQSYHIISTFKDNVNGFRYDRIKKIKFEIQVRTVSMDAWANISHHLSYKTEIDVPLDIRKDFNALSALFYLADSNFENVYKLKKDNIDKYDKSLIKNNKNNTYLDFDLLNEYMKIKFKDSRQSENSESISELLQQLHNSGYNTIERLDKVIDHGYDAFLKYQKKYPPTSIIDNKFNSVGIIRITISISDDNFASNHKNSIQNKNRYKEFRYLIKNQ
ncbi:GTP pyrophosphokinase family protein [Photobacterium sp. Alg240-V54]|uniref:GTP pyrophosphokinase n=1 Tax=Photobacterium sp. Alg240-V54 TaxID=2305995 RepID=UPI0013D7BC43|nr:hypothetical protein [Photobacterium sp. Alg240-V54]